MAYDPQSPYQNLPLLPPAKNIETSSVLKKTISAGRALARLDGACKRLPDPTMLINVIPILEAQASSEIENIVTTNDELFRAVSGASSEISPQTKEALRYREALHTGFLSLPDRPITSTTAKQIGSIINGRPAEIRQTPGTYIGNPVTQKRIYTPPEGKEVILDLLSNWEKFIHDSGSLDPLIIMAVSHYQFEAIHPFYDGNGRTGRVLNLLLLIEKGLLDLPVIYLSGHIVRHKETYYSLLNAVTSEGAWEDWVLFMLDGVESTSNWTFGIVEATDQLRREAIDQIRDIAPKLPASEIAQLMFTQPYLRIENVVNAGLASRQTASLWLHKLSDNHLLTKEKVGRNVLFINHTLLHTLFTTPLPE